MPLAAGQRHGQAVRWRPVENQRRISCGEQTREEWAQPVGIDVVQPELAVAGQPRSCCAITPQQRRSDLADLAEVGLGTQHPGLVVESVEDRVG